MDQFYLTNTDDRWMIEKAFENVREGVFSFLNSSVISNQRFRTDYKDPFAMKRNAKKGYRLRCFYTEDFKLVGKVIPK